MSNSKTLTAFEAFQEYISLKLYFLDKFDYFTYNGKTSIKPETFEKRNDKRFFWRLKSLFDKKSLKDLYVVNLRESPKRWIGKFEENKHLMYEKQTFEHSFSYKFSNELEYLFNQVDDPKDIFKIEDGNNPLILTEFYRKNISTESFVTLNILFRFFDTLDSKLDDKIVWPEKSLLLRKFTPFLRVKPEKAQKIFCQEAKKFLTKP